MVLQTLHHALVYSTRPHQGQKSRLEFGIKLEENPHAIKERVRDQEDLCLEDTYLFALQVHKAGSESGERSHCLLVEVPTSDVHQADNLSQPIHHLHLTIRDEVDGTDEEACYTLLGHVSEPSATKTPASCRVFQDQTETYITKKTLVDFLQEPKFRTTKYVNQHMQLARLVVNTYLNFAPMERVLGSSCALARNYRYYVATSDIKEAVVPTLPPSESFLNPFLFCGFGSKQKRYGGRSLVQSNGVSSLTSADIRIMELGLLLFQIGSWQSLDCSFPQEADYEDMRRKAKAKMYSVHKHCGVRFGELVLTCLDWRGQKGKGKEASPDPAGGMVSGDDEAALAVKIIGVLKDLENRLQVMRGQPSFLIPFLQVNSYA